MLLGVFPKETRRANIYEYLFSTVVAPGRLEFPIILFIAQLPDTRTIFTCVRVPGN